MVSYRHKYSVAKMASCLGVSASSYYDYRSEKYTVRVVKKSSFRGKELYGSAHLSVELKANGAVASRTTVAKYMKELGLRSKFHPKFRNTTDSKRNNPVAQNLLTAQRMRTEIFEYIEC